MSDILGIGFVGAGPVTQAIHLPTLSRLTDRLRIAHVMDVDPAVAATVAGRVGAAHSTTLEALLADPAVEIVAITSPSAFHAAQAEAAIRAGKRAVLVEKPFAVSGEEAARLAAMARDSGVPIVVGAMHGYDPGWLSAESEWADTLAATRFIRSSILIPPNPLFEDWATEVAGRGPPPPSRDLTNPDVRAAAVSGSVLNLAIHNLPLIRSCLPEWRDAEVRFATPLAPFGYLINMVAGDRRVQMIGSVHRHRRPEWRLDLFGAEAEVQIDFTPSYVHAGSATATRRAGGRSETVTARPGNGYEGEWRHLHGVLVAGTPLLRSVDTLIDDLAFAIRIADQAAVIAREGRF